MFERPVQLARGAEVDILDGAADVAQLRRAHAGLESPAVAAGDLAVDQQAEPFSVAQLDGGVLGLQFGERLGHAVEPKCAEVVQGRVGEHRLSFQWK